MVTYAPTSILDKPQRQYTVINWGLRKINPQPDPGYYLKCQGTLPGSNYHYWQFELITEQKEDHHE